MKTAQIILYNQLREEYLDSSVENFCYIHHIGKINFQGKELKLNTASKIMDYAGGKYMIDMLQKNKKNANFIVSKSFFEGLMQYAKLHDIGEFLIVEPVEDYVYKKFLKIQKKLSKNNIKLTFLEDTYSFFMKPAVFEKKYPTPPTMEFFYRFIRKKEDILIEDGQPTGGQWNYDKENRKFDKNHQKSWNFILEKNHFVNEAEKFYNFEMPFLYPTNREEALKLLSYFIKNHLDNFGRLEDAMYSHDNYVHHSLLSSSINYGMLSPREVVAEVEKVDTQMNNKEGFIRQVLGWREYMYHFFQAYKDTIYSKNFLEHSKKLPDYFWKNARDSDMNCLSTTLQQVQTENMSHHIQRLMIIGNYSLLTNRDPHELNRWFFEYYVDAFEWVVTPNVLGMSQYADGGKLATKPYIASANYINKMSDYCKSCKYDYKEKYNENACPYNYLYWNFVHDNKITFERGRQQFVVNNLKKIDIEKIQELKKQFLKREAKL